MALHIKSIQINNRYIIQSNENVLNILENDVPVLQYIADNLVVNSSTVVGNLQCLKLNVNNWSLWSSNNKLLFDFSKITQLSVNDDESASTVSKKYKSTFLAKKYVIGDWTITNKQNTLIFTYDNVLQAYLTPNDEGNSN